MSITKKKQDLLQKLLASWLSCLTMMVQGNLLAVSPSHLLIAAKTAIGAMIVYGISSFWVKTMNPLSESALLAAATALVDVGVHPTHFGAWWTEAVATGIAAGVLNYCVTLLLPSKKT